MAKPADNDVPFEGTDPSDPHAGFDLARVVADGGLGLRVVDRGLVVSLAEADELRADVVALEPTGRLVLVSAVADGGPDTVLAAITMLSSARRALGAIDHHLREHALRTDLSPRIVLVAHAFDRGSVDRLRALDRDLLELYELRRVRSEQHESTYLAPVLGEERRPFETQPSRAEVEDAFVDALPDALGGLARTLLGRIARVDDELVVRGGERGVVWSFHGSDLARLERAGDALRVAAPPSGPPHEVEDEAQLDAAVDAVLERHARAIGAGPNAGDGEEADDLGERGRLPVEELATLTREELAVLHAPD